MRLFKSKRLVKRIVSIAICLVLNLTVPEDSYIGIFKLSPMLGWKKKKMVWKNRNLEIEKRPQKRSIS